MPKRSIEYLELQSLLSSLCDEQITDAQRQRLFEIIEADPAARRFYIDYLDLDASLRWRCAESDDQPPELGEPLSKPQEKIEDKTLGSSVADFLGRCFDGGLSFLGKSSVFSILVAVFAPIGMCVLMLALVYETPPEPVALIARSRDCVGRLDDQPAMFHAGSNLFEAQRLAIDKGLVEIQFTGGASALIEGPASFEIVGPNAGSLTRGRLAAVVPPEARGFAIETPSARVVDLGTEFGVLVDDDGRVEAHVFGGQVEVVVPGDSADLPAETALLAQGEAVHIATADDKPKSSRMVRIPAATEQFTRTISLPEPTILFAHRGSADPTTQGWTAHYRQYGPSLPKDGVPLGQIDRVVGPIEGDGEAAWRIQPVPVDRWVLYDVRQPEGLTRELRAEAREKGWVLRARIRIDAKNADPKGGKSGLCTVSYRDGKQTWGFYPRLDADGNQRVAGVEPSTGPFADSRGRYLDYELRYDPNARNAELYVNGRHVATMNAATSRDMDDPKKAPYAVLRFAGTRDGATEVRFAKVEWGILRDAKKIEARR